MDVDRRRALLCKVRANAWTMNAVPGDASSPDYASTPYFVELIRMAAERALFRHRPAMFARRTCPLSATIVLFIGLLLAHTVHATDLPRTIATVKQSIVAIGSYEKTRAPAVKVIGTGFVVGDGLTVITNAHVSRAAVTNPNETLGIIIGKGNDIQFRSASVIGIETAYDLARLKFSGSPLPALELGDSDKVAEGESIAFTGFPLGMVLGLHPVTHRGIISAITPIVIPASDSSRLDPRMIAQMRRPALHVFQLDGTAYPGNSGSPLFDPATGVVYGVINMVFVKGTKESAISHPSGITYAIPSKYVHELMRREAPQKN